MKKVITLAVFVWLSLLSRLLWEKLVKTQTFHSRSFSECVRARVCVGGKIPVGKGEHDHCTHIYNKREKEKAL